MSLKKPLDTTEPINDESTESFFVELTDSIANEPYESIHDEPTDNPISESETDPVLTDDSSSWTLLNNVTCPSSYDSKKNPDSKEESVAYLAPGASDTTEDIPEEPTQSSNIFQGKQNKVELDRSSSNPFDGCWCCGFKCWPVYKVKNHILFSQQPFLDDTIWPVMQGPIDIG